MNPKSVLYIVLLAVITLGTGTIVAQSNASSSDSDFPVAVREYARAPTVISGDNVYIVWFTNVGTVNSNYEVGFRASTDNGQTFGPITNVSNTDNYDSVNAEISAEGDNIIVSYWEQNETSFLPYAKVSTDGGQTFGERLNITDNAFGTISGADEAVE
ncbi:MAG TPA: hypothetical protein VJR94_12700 [Candidatus Nitrosocosmicus sp.]|nr:hypothetical protein [Candidatus Nitrosocosmicus sp.]